MADPAREYSDSTLEDLTKRIHDIYSEALESASKEEFVMLSQYEGSLKQMEGWLKEGKITQGRFDRWKADKAAQMVRSQGIVDQLAVRANASNNAAANMVNDTLPGVFAEGANWSAYDIGRQAGALNAFSVVNEDAVRRLVMENPELIPRAVIDDLKDVAWNQQKFSSAVTQSILLGESVSKLAMRVQQIMAMDERHAAMLARTALNGAENAGRDHTFSRAQDMGIEFEVYWEATPDGKTRDSHVLLDGEMRKDGYFSNGLRYPCDPGGPPEEVANCRCRMDGQVKGLSRTDYSDLSSRFSRLAEDMTYDEWKEQARENIRANGG